MKKIVKKGQFGLLAKYAGKEVAEKLAQSTGKAAVKKELAKGAEKMATKNLPSSVVAKRAKAAAAKESYRPTSLSERLSGARQDFYNTVGSRSSNVGPQTVSNTGAVKTKNSPVRRNVKADENYKKGGVIKKAKSGGKQMLKRADGSVSQRGLWDNIRAAKGSGKKPTAAMLKQEKKIKAKTKK
jgi:hypothetical protein